MSAEDEQISARLAATERRDRELAARDSRDDSRHTAAHTVYLLMVLPFAVTQVGALALAYRMRRQDDESWLNQHFDWQIRTFWYLLLLAVPAGITLVVALGSLGMLVLGGKVEAVNPGFKAVVAFGITVVISLGFAVYRIGNGW